MGADVKVLKRTADGALSLGLDRPPVKIEGIDKLVQIVALTFLTNPGRSIFSPGKGGGIRSLIGSNIDPEEPEELFADVRLMIDRVRDYIVQTQVNTTRPPSERLKELQLVDIVLNDNSDQVEILIAVINDENDVGQALVPIT
ncbi:hypothetical protein LCGC14_1095510 [marine sediment metagenome]|uniref:IraD/Gp25-like domain-containing protein n=1 Tax=marine sediment metagenome TaxID=412755 RepID=A0A0F9MB27_9ZZZZ